MAIANTAVVRPQIEEPTLLNHLFYLINNEDFWPESGTGQTFVQTGVAQKQILIPLAPLEEQRHIVARLGEITRKIEAARARLEQVPRLLERLRQSVWREKNGNAEPVELPESEEVEDLEKWRRVFFGFVLSELCNGLPTKPSLPRRECLF